MNRVLDYRPRFDDRSAAFTAPRLTSSRRWRYWRCGPVLDQGTEGACVGHGTVGALLASPLSRAIPHPQQAAFGVYELAQHLDQWEGENYSGTSVLAGTKVLHKAGWVSGYEWCHGADHVAEVVLERGPVIIGIDWMANMRTPGPDGVLDCGGSSIGGHCLFVSGFSRSRRVDGEPGAWFRVRNSWGADWGVGGSAFIRHADLDGLLVGGEACLPIG